MAWDTERTKTLLLEAAIEEFSQYGLAGARMDKIACRAGVSKERIYQYFGKKADLFGAAYHHVLMVAQDAVPLLSDDTGPDVIGSFAGRLFDYHQSHTQLVRLTYWEGLERAAPKTWESRTTHNVAKVDALQKILPGVAREDAAELLTTIFALCNTWPILRNLDTDYENSTPEERSAKDMNRRRAVVAGATAAARLLVEDDS